MFRILIQMVSGFMDRISSLGWLMVWVNGYWLVGWFMVWLLIGWLVNGLDLLVG